MEVVEVDPSLIKYCRCCYKSYFEDEMENIFEIELHEIINLLSTVSILAEDSKLQNQNLRFSLSNFSYRLLSCHLRKL